jgi:hypothetical protein
MISESRGMRMDPVQLPSVIIGSVFHRMPWWDHRGHDGRHGPTRLLDQKRIWTLLFLSTGTLHSNLELIDSTCTVTISWNGKRKKGWGKPLRSRWKHKAPETESETFCFLSSWWGSSTALFQDTKAGEARQEHAAELETPRAPKSRAPTCRVRQRHASLSELTLSIQQGSNQQQQ